MSSETPSMTIEQGKNVLNAFKAMEVFTNNLASLIEDLKLGVKGEIQRSPAYRAIDNKSKLVESDLSIENGWIFTGESFSLPIIRRPERTKETGCLSYQFQILGADAETVGEPLLHVCFWEYPVKFMKGECFCFGTSDEEDVFELTGNRLVTWETEDDRLPVTWTYSIRLLSLHDKNALRELAIAPAIALIGLNEIRDPTLWKAKALGVISESLLGKGILAYDPKWFEKQV